MIVLEVFLYVVMIISLGFIGHCCVQLMKLIWEYFWES